MMLIRGTIAIAVILSLWHPGCLSASISVLKTGSNSNPHIHIKPGDAMVLECPVKNMDKLIEIDWYRNDVDKSYGCQVISPTKFNPVSKLYCPNMTIIKNEGVYSCEHYYDDNIHEIADVMVFVKDESIFTIDSCFCIGLDCQNTNMSVRHQKKVQLFSESLSPILITTTGAAETITPNFTIFESKNINTVPQSKVNGTIYYALSENITKMKIDLFGGWFSYELSPLVKDMFANDEYAPLAVMRGADKVLVHYDTERLNRNSRYKRLSFRHHNWVIIKQNIVFETAREDEVLEVLSNLEGIYIKLNYHVQKHTVENYKVDLYTVKFAENGSGIPSSIGRCSCPPAFDGEYCERCAENYSGSPMSDTYCYSTADGVDKRLLAMTGENARNNPTNTEETRPSDASDSANDKDDKISTGSGDINTVEYPDENEKSTETDENGSDDENEEYLAALDSGILYCVDGCDKNRTSEAFNVKPGQPMTLQCPTLHAIETIWYRNDGKVLSDCVVTHQAGNSFLFCPHMTSYHEGVYSCERYYELIEAKITRTAVLVGEGSSFKQPFCFCFGAATSCEPAKVAIDNEEVKMFNTSLPPVVLMMENGQRTLMEASTTELKTVKGTVYYPLSEEITKNKLNLAGGFILYDQSTGSDGIDTEDVGFPLALMRGGDKVLFHHQDENYNSSLNRIRVSFSAFNWYVLSDDENTVDVTSERDVMTVLSDLDGIYVRLKRGVDIAELTDDFAVLYMINPWGMGTLSYIGKCSCPPEYAGTYCESCAENYTRESLNHACGPVNRDNERNAANDSKVLKDTDETPGESPQSNGQSHFYLYEHKEYATPHLHVKPEDTMTLECPISHTDDLLEINWYRNDRGVPSKCQFISLTESNFVSRLYCPNMTVADEGVYRCEHVHADDSYSQIYYNTDVLVFVKAASVFEIDSCFCFGATTTCHRINVTEEVEEVQLFSESSSPILLTASNHGKTITANYRIFEGQKMDKISASTVDGTVYYALSEEITSLTLELYGGSFTYLLSEDPTLVDENSPLAVMRGDDKLLVYYESGKCNKNSQYKRLSFSKYNWHLLHGDSMSEENVSEAQIMKVLSNLKGIYLKTYYVVDDYEVKDIAVDLYLLKFQRNGGVGMPTSIGKCSCPLGYAGIFCERCAENYSGNPTNDSSCVSVFSRFSEHVQNDNNNPEGERGDTIADNFTRELSEIETVRAEAETESTLTSKEARTFRPIETSTVHSKTDDVGGITTGKPLVTYEE